MPLPDDFPDMDQTWPDQLTTAQLDLLHRDWLEQPGEIGEALMAQTILRLMDRVTQLEAMNRDRDR